MGLEPTIPKKRVPKTRAYANFATELRSDRAPYRNRTDVDCLQDSCSTIELTRQTLVESA